MSLRGDARRIPLRVSTGAFILDSGPTAIGPDLVLGGKSRS